MGINSERLEQVGNAEYWLRVNGFREVRVRSNGLSAKIEVPANQIQKLILEVGEENILKHFVKLGFTSVSIDPEGLVSGKLKRNN